MKTRYTITVDCKYGTVETYVVEAKSVAEARKKAKAKFVSDYFRRSYLKTYVDKY